MKTKTKGIFKQRNDGFWSIDTKIKIGNEFKHFEKRGYRTLSDAKNDFENAKREFIIKNTNHYSNNYFDSLLEEYKKMRAIKVNETTLQTDRSIYNVYLLPYYGGREIKKCLTKEFVSEWYDNIVNSTKYSQNKKSKVITRFKDLLLFAYNHKYIDAPTYQDIDVCVYQVNNYKTPKSERVVWTKLEEERFIQATEHNKKDNIMFKVFISMGAKISEFLALQVKCFDYDKRKLVIKQQLVNCGNGLHLTDKLKSHDSYRNVIIPHSLADELNKYIKDFNLKDDDFIFFGNSKKAAIGKTTFRRKLNYYCDVADVRKCNPHALRHRSAVILSSVASNMAELEICAKRLGHSPEMFMNTYANHTNDERQNELIDRIYNC